MKGNCFSRGTFPILFRDLSFREPSKSRGNRSGCLKRTMVEKNGQGINPWSFPYFLPKGPSTARSRRLASARTRSCGPQRTMSSSFAGRLPRRTPQRSKRPRSRPLLDSRCSWVSSSCSRRWCCCFCCFPCSFFGGIPRICVCVFCVFLKSESITTGSTCIFFAGGFSTWKLCREFFAQAVGSDTPGNRLVRGGLG